MNVEPSVPNSDCDNGLVNLSLKSVIVAALDFDRPLMEVGKKGKGGEGKLGLKSTLFTPKKQQVPAKRFKKLRSCGRLLSYETGNTTGDQYGVQCCGACKSFFKRSIRLDWSEYICFSQRNCSINLRGRKLCQYCRFQKCVSSGMLNAFWKYLEDEEGPFQSSDRSVDTGDANGLEDTAPLDSMDMDVEEDSTNAIRPAQILHVRKETEAEGSISCPSSPSSKQSAYSVSQTSTKPLMPGKYPSNRLNQERPQWFNTVGKPCQVCVFGLSTAPSSNYGTICCLECREFFNRTVGKNPQPSCDFDRTCAIKKGFITCQYCWFQKCRTTGMRTREEFLDLQDIQEILLKESMNEILIYDPSAYPSATSTTSRFDKNDVPKDEEMNVTDSGTKPNFANEGVFSIEIPGDDQNDSGDSPSSSQTSSELVSSIASSDIEEELSSSSPSSIATTLDFEPTLETANDTARLVPEVLLDFNFTAPLRCEITTKTEIIQADLETTVGILSYAFHWISTLPIFEYMNDEVKFTIIQSGWTGLFIISFTQMKYLISSSPLELLSPITHTTEEPHTSESKVASANMFWHVVRSIEDLGLDHFEFAYLKVLALFNTERYFQHLQLAENQIPDKDIQQLALEQLTDHIAMKLGVNESAQRISKILLLLPRLRSISPNMIQQVFSFTVDFGIFIFHLDLIC